MSDISNKNKKIQISLSNNTKIINTQLNNVIIHFFSKTTKNSPHKINNLRNKSFNFKNNSNQISKANLKIDNSLNNTGDFKNLSKKYKNKSLNLKSTNTNFELKKVSNNINDFNKNKSYNYQNLILDLINNSNKKDNYISNDIDSKTSFNHKNNNTVNNSINRLIKSKDSLNKVKISPIKFNTKCFSIKNKNDNNKGKRNCKLTSNSLKNKFIKRVFNSKKRINQYQLNKIQSKKQIKDITKINKIKISDKLKNKKKTKFNEISFNNIPKIFQVKENKKQTRNFNYHKKQPSLSLTKTSNISQYNFLESNSSDNMISQILGNKNNNTSNFNNNNTTLYNDISSQYNDTTSIYSKITKEKNELLKENNELKQTNKNLLKKINKLNEMINVLKKIIYNIKDIYINFYINIKNKYKEKEIEIKNSLKNYISFVKEIIYYNKYYSFLEINKNKKIFQMIKQILIENKILRNLYNNLLIFDINNDRLCTNLSENNYYEYEKNSNKISFSNRTNKFFDEENNENNKRSDTAEQKNYNIIENIGKINNNHPQSRNYNKNELNLNLINNNKLLKKCFIRKLNYKIKK